MVRKIWKPSQQILKKASDILEGFVQTSKMNTDFFHLPLLSVSLVCLPLSCDVFTLFSTRSWDDHMLSDACRWVLDEIYIPPAAKGGMVEYRRTLIISLLFKFYLKVRRGLNKKVNDFSGSLSALTF